MAELNLVSTGIIEVKVQRQAVVEHSRAQSYQRTPPFLDLSTSLDGVEEMLQYLVASMQLRDFPVVSSAVDGQVLARNGPSDTRRRSFQITLSLCAWHRFSIVLICAATTDQDAAADAEMCMRLAGTG